MVWFCIRWFKTVNNGINGSVTGQGPLPLITDFNGHLEPEPGEQEVRALPGPARSPGRPGTAACRPRVPSLLVPLALTSSLTFNRFIQDLIT